MNDLERFLTRLLETLKARNPAGVHRPFTVAELRSTILPYRMHRSALRLSSSEDYELLILRLVAEEGGYARANPPASAERAKAEIAHPNPDLDLVDVLAETTIQIGAAALTRLAAIEAAERAEQEKARVETAAVAGAPQMASHPESSEDSGDARGSSEFAASDPEPKPAADTLKTRETDPAPDVPAPPVDHTAIEGRAEPAAVTQAELPAERPSAEPIGAREPPFPRQTAGVPDGEDVRDDSTVRGAGAVLEATVGPDPDSALGRPPLVEAASSGAVAAVIGPSGAPTSPDSLVAHEGAAEAAIPDLPSQSGAGVPAPDRYEAPAAGDGAGRAVEFEPIADSISVDGVTATTASGRACASCGVSLPSGRSVAFCPYCGEQVGIRRCRRCGSEMESEWRYCGACGESHVR